MTKSVVNLTENLSTTDFISIVTKRRDQCVRDIIRDTNGRIALIRWYSDSSHNTQLYSKEILWVNNALTLIKHNDLVNGLTRCKSLLKIANTTQVNTEICLDGSSFWVNSTINWGDSQVDWS